jgi:hypothetical protein
MARAWQGARNRGGRLPPPGHLQAAKLIETFVTHSSAKLLAAMIPGGAWSFFLKETDVNKSIPIVMIFLAALPAHAVLAPQQQNLKDLEVMVSFIRSFPKVASSLKSIDFENYTIHFGKNCRAVFGREVITRPAGWAGPQGPLEFKESTCDLE